ncbi:hypothetical protein TNCV_5120781 [Trichonephila clavipes]|nr:hypothetical protein TNCV_5120781 [Trichonephila clavipes]
MLSGTWTRILDKRVPKTARERLRLDGGVSFENLDLGVLERRRKTTVPNDDKRSRLENPEWGGRKTSDAENPLRRNEPSV